MKEIWKPIKGYEDLYEVSNKGKVRRKNKILKPYIIKNGKGYECVALSKKGKVEKMLVHRLVAQNFIENDLNKIQVNHMDGDTRNNCVTNLEWVTNAENTQHAYDTGLNSKVVLVQVKDIKTGEIKKYSSMRKASIDLGYCQGWLYWAFKTRGDEFRLLNKSITKVGEKHVD